MVGWGGGEQQNKTNTKRNTKQNQQIKPAQHRTDDGRISAHHQTNQTAKQTTNQTPPPPQKTHTRNTT